MSIDPFRQCDEMYRGEATQKKKKKTNNNLVSCCFCDVSCNAFYLQYMWYLHLFQYNFSDVHFALVMSWSCGIRLSLIILPDLWLKGGRVGVLSRLNCTHPPTTCNSALDITARDETLMSNLTCRTTKFHLWRVTQSA